MFCQMIFVILSEVNASLMMKNRLKTEEKSKVTGLSLEEKALFTGSPAGLQGAAIISSELTEFISSQMRDKTAILKERRKAREEREADASTSGGVGTNPRRRRGPKAAAKPGADKG